VVTGDFGQEAVIWSADEELGTIRLSLRGRHNLQNALAAVAVGRELAIPFAQIAAGLAANQGVGRRAETHGEHGGVLVLDDYGHHPTEIAATLEVARSYGRKVAALFQPHRYTRTERFAREFADALGRADAVGLLPIYAASENPLPGVDSGLIAGYLAGHGPERVRLLSGPADLGPWLDEVVRAGDLVLTLGAGDIGRMVADVCGHLDRRNDKRAGRKGGSQADGRGGR
jgi:UDP-N-acetylmuramate--alanine ligase